jgi:hypothetical protein
VRLFKVLNFAYAVVNITATIFLMVWFENLTYDKVDEVNADAVLNSIKSNLFDQNTLFYQLFMSVIGWINGFAIPFFINRMNFQYQLEKDNALNMQMFAFQCVNTYLPPAFLAFGK